MARLTSASSVMTGNSIDFTLTLDAPAATATSYRWTVVFGSDAPAQIRDFGSENLSGDIVVGAGEREQTFTIPTRLNPANAGDRTFTVAILNSMNEEIVESGLITLEDTEGQASFSITSDNNVDIPLVGDVLTLSLDAVDPQGNRNPSYSYQWYDATDDTDIAGATGTSYTITDPGQIIGVRITYTDRGGMDEVVTVELGSASVTPVVDPSDYVVVQDSDGNGAETLAGTSLDEIIQGGNKDDVISTGGGDDIVIGGYGSDEITLDDEGADTIIYRFSSDGGFSSWTAVDGSDTINNFKRGVDKLVFADVDTDTPTDLATFLVEPSPIFVFPLLKDGSGGDVLNPDSEAVLTGLTIVFSGNGAENGPDGGASSGRVLTINWHESDYIPIADAAISEYFGAGNVGVDVTTFNSDADFAPPSGIELTDFSLFLNYFGASEGFTEGVQVVRVGELGIDITDVDANAATYVIDDSNSGDAEHITNPTGLAEGSTLYARISRDDPDGNGADGDVRYQWKRNGVDIDGATSATYVVTTIDIVQDLTVTVTYTDAGGEAESVTTNVVTVPYTNNGQASFIISSTGYVDTPIVGDELTVNQDAADPDGDGEGIFTYQWYVVGGADIASATDQTYTITETGQIIGVRVSYTDSEGFDETATAELSVASYIVDPSTYEFLQDDAPNDANTIAGTSAHEVIEGGNNDDTITTGGGNDIIVGGYGRDTITLSDDGAETVVYRFSSDAVTDSSNNTGWTAIDGADTINNFDRGTDKLVFVDVADNPVDLAGFLAGGDTFNVRLDFDPNDGNVLTGVTFQFIGRGLPERAGSETDANADTHSGRWLRINYKDEDKVTIFNPDGTTTDEGAELVGVNSAHYDPSSKLLTDFALLPNYFRAAGEDFADGLRLIKESDISVGSIAPIVERSEYELIQVGDGSGDDTVPSTLDVVDELIQGGNGDDRLGTSDGTDIIIGGYGQDFITLGTYSNRPAGHEETVVYRFSSDGDWTAIDGTDTINRFERGIDKLVLVDVADNPIDLATFLASADQFNVRLVFTDIAQVEMGGIIITFPEVGFANGPGTGDGDTDSGNELRVFFTEAITIFNPDRTVTEEGADFIGENGIYFDASTNELTDFSILPNFFGLELQDGLRLVEASDLGVAITDFPATYVIDNADSGEAEHITDTVGLHVGSTVYARIVTHDPDASGAPSYQWKRGGVDIVGATDAAYTLVLADEDESLTVAVTYRNDISKTDETFTSAAVLIPHNEGVSDFVIASNGDVNAPVVGDVLRVDRGTDDPDGNGDGVLSYQWFVMGGDDIAGATSHTYTLTDPDQIIGVRVTYIDGDGYSETAAPVLNIASQDVGLFDHPRIIQIGDGSGADTLTGTPLDELILGGDDDDTITTVGGNDIVSGGNGRDVITLSDNGAETIIYRFSSDGDWTAVDGGDRIRNFERGVDKLVLVDVANDPIDLATFLESENEFSVVVALEGNDGETAIDQIHFVFQSESDNADENIVTIEFKDWIVVADSSFRLTPQGELLLGVDGAGFDFTETELTDFSLLPNYFGIGFDDGLQVIASDDLATAFPPPVLDPSDHTLVKDGDGSGEDILAGTSADEIIQGGNNDDVITTGGGSNIVIGGYGRDRITLDDGAETIVYRFASPVASDDKWTAVDGADTVRNFKRGVDKLLFVDVGQTPVDLARFITLANATYGITRLEVELELIDNGNVLKGVKFKFSGNGFDDGPGSDDSSGKWLRIYFEETVTLFNPDGSITEEGIKLIGENGAGFNADTHLLTDFALLSEYFHDRFDVTTEGQLGVAVTDFPAVYVIDDSNIGAAEHITDRSGLIAGSTLYARALSNDPDADGDPSYQWKRSGVDIVGATGAVYTLSEFDEGESLTVTVTYRNDVSNTFESVTSAAVQILDNEGQAGFTITTNGDINALKVGDILKVSQDAADPDPDGDGTFTYQWFTAHGGYLSGPVREIDIEGATGNTYRILDAGQTIGVRVTYTDGDGFSEVVSSEFTAGSPIFEAATYTSVEPSKNEESLDDLLRTFADELGQTGNDIIYLGDTTSFLNPHRLRDDVAETIIHRFSSDGTWTGGTPNSRFTNFERGVDRLMLVDVGGNPIDLATFLESGSEFTVQINFDLADGRFFLSFITISFDPVFLNPDANLIRIHFKDPILVADSSGLTPQGELFLGVNRAGYDIASGQLTDFSLLPNYFGFDDGLQVVQPNVAAALIRQSLSDVDTSGDDTFVGTPSDEIHRSGDGDDRIVTNGGDDIVIGGYGADDITLSEGDGAETIVYRFSSDGTWTATDGGDTVNDFERGVDKLVLVDVADNPIDLATFLQSEDEFTTRVVFDGTIDDPAGIVLTGFSMTFPEEGSSAGPNVDGTDSGNTIRINFKTPIEGVFSPGSSISNRLVSDIGAKFLGVGGAGYSVDDQNNWELTDFSLLPNYFGEGFDEGLQVIARSELNLEGSSFAVPYTHTLVKNGDGDNSDTLVGTSADEFIVGGNRQDTITTNGGDDIVIGGYGRDDITLGEGDGAETIIYRFSSDGDWTATDGGDTVNDFERGVDTLVLVDVANDPIDLATLLESENEFRVSITFNSGVDLSAITVGSFSITFPEQGYSDGPDSTDGTASGHTIQINFKTPINNIFNNDGSVNDKGAKFLGVDGAGYDRNTGELTDLSLLPNYLGIGFDDGLQVISAPELAEFLATPIIDPSDYKLAEARNHQGENTLRGRTTDDIIQGGNKDDIINVRGGDDIVIGGYGRDTITLNNNGAETVVYRFSSDGRWTAIDGADVVHNFERGVDEMVLVDVGGNPIDLATLLESEHKFDVSLYRSGNELNGIAIRFSNPGFADGPGSSNGSGKWLKVFFDESITLFNSDGSVTDEGAQLIGDDGSKYDAATNKLTDFSLLPYYFDGEFGEGLRVIAPNELGVAITDVDAVYVIDDSNTGAAEHITDRTGLLAGSTLYARVLSNDPDTLNGDGDPSYQWKRSGVDIVGATGAVYTLSEFDEGESLTVTVTYRNDVSNTFESVTSAAVQILDNEGQAGFTITTNGDINALKVGDILKVSQDAADPDPDGDGTFTYQWFTAHGGYLSGPVREIDIEGATGNTYRILDAGQTIGVRVTYTDGDGFSEVVSSEFTAGSPIFEAATYTSVEPSKNEESLDDLLRTFADELGQTGNDIIYLGDTTSFLNPHRLRDDVAETIIHRFSSDGTWTGGTPNSRFTNFERGVDRLMLVDVGGNPIDLATFLESGSEFTVQINFDLADGRFFLSFITISFDPVFLNPDANLIRIHFKDPILVADSSGLTPQGELFLGVNRAGYDIASGELMDFSLLPNYFGIGFDDGLQVVESSAAVALIRQSLSDVDTSGDDTFVGTPSDEIHRSGDGDDRIVTNGGDDIVIGGYGADDITLSEGDGAETIVYRFSSDGAWTATDGGDTVNDFERGVDKLVLVDSADDPIDLATFLQSEDDFRVNLMLDFDGRSEVVADVVLRGFSITFPEDGSSAGPNVDGTDSGNTIRITFKTPIEGVFSPGSSINNRLVSDIGAKFLGVGGAGYDLDDLNNWELTDFSLLPNYFGEGFDDGLQVIASSDLNLKGSSFAVPYTHTPVKNGDGDNSDTLVGTSADEFIVGGNRQDTITTNGGDDIVIGGYGRDDITLGEGDGAETIIYRFSSDDDWTATDGGDTVNDFERGVDTLVLVDVANDPIDLATLLESENEFRVSITFNSGVDLSAITVGSFSITFPEQGYSDGPDSTDGTASGHTIQINFKTPINNIFNNDGSVNDKGAKFLGVDGAGYDRNTGELTDLSLLPNYLGIGFDDGLQVISATGLAEFLATPVIDPSDYKLDAARNHQGENTLRGRTTDDIIQGGNKDDIINVRGGDDIVIGGYGRDTITLNNNGAETIVYRFSSDGRWTAIDGADMVHNFERGVDAMVLVDVGGNPIDLATLLESEHKFDVSFNRNGNELNGIIIKFSNPGFADGPGSSDGSGKWLRVFFDESITLFNSDGSVTDEGAQLIGDDGSKYDAATNKLTDFSLLPYYFDGEFGEGLRVIAPNELGVAITDFPAVYVIDDSNRGSVEQVTASNLVAGTKLYARALRSDPDADGGLAYQWMRNGRDIAGATQATYTVTKVDEGDRLSVVVTYRNGVSETDESVTSAAVSVPTVSDGGGSFTIISVNDVPRVGDVLSVSQSQDDPDGNGDGTFSYQWFIAGEGNIAGATEPEHRITEAGQIIGVRVTYTDDEGYDQTVSTKLSVASIEPVVNPFVYTNAIQEGDGSGVNVLEGTAADELFQGGADSDIISIAGGSNVVIGGHGSDAIFLDAHEDENEGVQTIVYRFSSSGDSGWSGVDGIDTLHSFERGIDKFVFVDVDTDTSVDRATFLESEGKFNVSVIFSDGSKDDTTTIKSFQINFAEEINSNLVEINYKNPIGDLFDSAGAATEQGAKFFGEGFERQTGTTIGRLNDFDVLLNYFGEGFDDGLQVIKPSELGVDII